MTRFSAGFLFKKAVNSALALTYRGKDHQNNAAVSTQTFSAKAIGTASADRWVFVLIASRNATARTLNSVTIGGVTATIETPVGAHDSVNGQVTIAFALVPTGTTADIVLNWSGTFTASTANGSGIDWYTVVGALNTTASDSFSDNTVNTPVTKNFTVPAGGVALVIGVSNNVSHAVSGDFTLDDNFVQYVAGPFRAALSVANGDNAASASKSVTCTSFSSGGSAAAKIGKAYGHV